MFSIYLADTEEGSKATFGGYDLNQYSKMKKDTDI